MEKFHSLYEQYSILKDKLKENQDDFTTDLSKYGMTEDYYKKVDQATEQLCKFYTVKLENASIHNALAYMLNDSHSENVKFCMLIDVLRCYDGLDHPTTFTTPEGIALMILLDKILLLLKLDKGVLFLTFLFTLVILIFALIFCSLFVSFLFLFLFI